MDIFMQTNPMYRNKSVKILGYHRYSLQVQKKIERPPSQKFNIDVDGKKNRIDGIK